MSDPQHNKDNEVPWVPFSPRIPPSAPFTGETIMFCRRIFCSMSNTKTDGCSATVGLVRERSDRQLPLNSTPQERLHENNSAGDLDSVTARRSSDLAVQRGVGLLPERRIGFGVADRRDIGANGSSLVTVRSVGHKTSALEPRQVDAN